eukprot:1889691-Amphidinium_carterae.1
MNECGSTCDMMKGTWASQNVGTGSTQQHLRDPTVYRGHFGSRAAGCLVMGCFFSSYEQRANAILTELR